MASDPPQRLDTLALFERAALRRVRSAVPGARPRACSPSTPRSAPARPAAASAARSASTTGWSSPMRRARCAAAPSSPGRPSPTPNARRTWRSSQAARHPARYAVARAVGRGAQLGDRGRRRLDAGRSGTARSASSPGSRRSAYKMHVRVLLSRYRAYTPCAACDGARLKTRGAAVAHRQPRACRRGARRARRASGRAVWSGAHATLAALPGLSIHDLMLLPVERSCEFFQQARAAAAAR